MDIDFIIPAKANSLRVPNKNWRDFTGDGRSLVDLTIEKLIAAGAERNRIFVSCEDETKSVYCRDKGVQFLLRDASLCDNSVPLTTWLRSIVEQSGATGDVAWCQVCDPLFDDYKKCLKLWRGVQANHDSLVVCWPWRGYLMTQTGHPIGWSFGEHHTPSQRLPKFLTMPFTFSILSQRAIENTAYHVGRNPYWYETEPGVDIDTERDFRVAQLLWRDQCERLS
jgi:N-acylneuraminate cytidylyltransferase